MAITTGGDVGTGTTNPQSRLEVSAGDIAIILLSSTRQKMPQTEIIF